MTLKMEKRSQFIHQKKKEQEEIYDKCNKLKDYIIAEYPWMKYLYRERL
jgi:hypothetical protein